jgi:ribosomal-protein-alanine N-acetyltransferase
MRVADLPEVHAIELASFTTPWPTHAYRSEIETNRLASYLVARGDGHVVGYGGVWLMVDEAHITTFGVHPGWRRQGVGRRLLLRLMDMATELGALRMTLEVRVSNVAAQELYRSFGFTIDGTRVRYYTDDGEDAFVMTTPDLARQSLQDLIAAERARQQS